MQNGKQPQSWGGKLDRSQPNHQPSIDLVKEKEFRTKSLACLGVNEAANPVFPEERLGRKVLHPEKVGKGMLMSVWGRLEVKFTGEIGSRIFIEKESCQVF